MPCRPLAVSASAPSFDQPELTMKAPVASRVGKCLTSIEIRIVVSLSSPPVHPAARPVADHVSQNRSLFRSSAGNQCEADSLPRNNGRKSLTERNHAPDFRERSSSKPTRSVRANAVLSGELG